VAVFALLVALFAVVWVASRVLSRESAARRAAQRELDRFFTLSLDLLCIAGVDGRFKRLNPAFERVLGFSREELLAQPFAAFVHPDDVGRTVREAERLALEGTDTVAFVNRYRAKDGTYRTLQWNTAPDPESGLLYAAARDITEEQRLHRELSHRLVELEAANRELESFSYSVSHDLRAPLRAMDGFSQAVLEDEGGRLGPRGADYLGRIRQAALRMSALIDALLTLSRLARLEPKRQPVDVSGLAEAVVRELRQVDPGREVDVRIEPGLAAEADPRLVRAALENLLGNAWKFTSRGGPARIELFAERAGSERVFRVRDDGVGFDMQYAGKLFGAFQRLHGAAEFPGTGIGLATVQRIVRRHGGRIWAESAPGRGATFSFTLAAPEGSA
jgi:PAS domain S-box-containing protein